MIRASGYQWIDDDGVRLRSSAVHAPRGIFVVAQTGGRAGDFEVAFLENKGPRRHEGEWSGLSCRTRDDAVRCALSEADLLFEMFPPPAQPAPNPELGF